MIFSNSLPQQVQSYRFLNFAVFHIGNNEKAAKTFPTEKLGPIREVINVHVNRRCNTKTPPIVTQCFYIVMHQILLWRWLTLWFPICSNLRSGQVKFYRQQTNDFLLKIGNAEERIYKFLQALIFWLRHSSSDVATVMAWL